MENMENKEEIKIAQAFIHNGSIHAKFFNKRSRIAKYQITRSHMPMAYFTNESDRDIVFEYLRKFWT